MTDFVVYEAALITHGCYEGCTLKISSGGFELNIRNRQSLQIISPNQIKSVSWCQMARGFGLKIACDEEKMFQICSLDSTEFDRISDFLSSNLNIVLKKQDISVKGKNQGDLSVEASSLRFNVDHQTCFEVPYKEVCRVTSSKSEIGMEFHPINDVPVTLMEMRLHVPNESVKGLANDLSSKADVIKATTEALLSIPDVSCMTPRGRYTTKIYPTFLELYGKSFDFKIPHSSIKRLFSVQGNEPKTHTVVISIEPAIRHGQTRYPFIIIQFDEHLDLYASILTEQNGHGGNVSLHKKFCDVIEKVSMKKISPSGDFKISNNLPYVPCSCKTSNGFLYPIQQGFLFVHKPPSFTRFEEISCIDFARGTLSARTFDMEFNLRNGQTILFNNIDRENYGPLHSYCISNNIKIRKASEKIKLSDPDIEINTQFRPEVPIDDSDLEDADYNPFKEETSSSGDETKDVRTEFNKIKIPPQFDPRFMKPF